MRNAREPSVSPTRTFAMPGTPNPLELGVQGLAQGPCGTTAVSACSERPRPTWTIRLTGTELMSGSGRRVGNCAQVRLGINSSVLRTGRPGESRSTRRWTNERRSGRHDERDVVAVPAQRAQLVAELRERFVRRPGIILRDRTGYLGFEFLGKP